MKSHLTILAIALVLCTGIQAKERTPEQKRQIAFSILSKNAAATRAVSLNNLKELKTMNELTIVGNSDANGFAIISNDDNNEAVLGWSDKRFNSDKMPDGLEWWLNMANEVLGNSRHYTRTVMPATVGNGSLPATVESFVPATWGQGDPYNQACGSIKGSKALTGCVATAAAQIMYYYKYPTQGAGESMIDEAAFDFVDFANTTYDYFNMLPSYKKGEYTPEQASAVATLMHHCGVATSMDYGTDASGAYCYKAAGAWRDHFSYSTEFYRRDAYPEDEWMSIIYEELGNYRPIQYGGVDEKSGGHSFVFDGYDADGLVHVNWGWEGSSDGYYDVALLNPQNYQYNQQQEMILMHTPDAPTLSYRSQWGIIDGSFTVSVTNSVLKYSATNLYNVDSDPFVGQMCLVVQPEDGGKINCLDVSDIVDDAGQMSEVDYLYGFSSYSDSVDISDIPDGVYYVYMATKATTESEWQPVHFNETVKGVYELTIADGNASVSSVETGIDNLKVNNGMVNGKFSNRIYTIDGHYVGTDASKLSKGLYICNGKKFVKE